MSLQGHHGHSRFLEELMLAQRHLNYFFWSSEIAYELVRQKVLANQESDECLVHEVFSDIKCHAFVPPHRGTPAKYICKVSSFRDQLSRNLEQVSRYVIVRFHSCLEHFLQERIRSTELWSTKQIIRLLKLPYQDLACELRKKSSLRSEIRKLTALRAQINRLVRNDVVHREASFSDECWADERVYQDALRLGEKSTEVVTKNERDLAIDQVCHSARNHAKENPTVPILFFYALFSLTNYRALAMEVDGALPVS